MVTRKVVHQIQSRIFFDYLDPVKFCIFSRIIPSSRTWMQQFVNVIVVVEGRQILF
jgi:hypothetical protein